MRKSKGFTLLELLMVVIIIAILASIALPAYLKATEKSRSTEALQILGQIRASENRYKAMSAAGAYSANQDDLDVVDTTAKGVVQTRSWGNYGGPPAGSNLNVTITSAKLTRKGGIYDTAILGMLHNTGALCGNYAVVTGLDSSAVACP
jgi:prepilin-type N-terminal cleavage/methylation domain-containing protein